MGAARTAPHRPRRGPASDDPLAGHRRGRDARPRPRRPARRRGRFAVIALNRADLDVTDAEAVAAAVRRHQPDVVVNCAAWTAVDDAEAREDEALAVNGRAVALPGRRLRGRRRRPRPGLHRLRLRRPRRGARTGKTTRPRRAAPTAGPSWPASRPSARRCPDGSYVVRTAWLYGAHGASFVRTMLGRARAAQPGRRRRRPAGPAHLDRRRGRADPRAGLGRRPRWHLPRHQLGRDHLVRPRAARCTPSRGPIRPW